MSIIMACNLSLMFDTDRYAETLAIHVSCIHYRVLSKYYVGELIDNEFPVFPKERLA